MNVCSSLRKIPVGQNFDATWEGRLFGKYCKPFSFPTISIHVFNKLLEARLVFEKAVGQDLKLKDSHCEVGASGKEWGCISPKLYKNGKCLCPRRKANEICVRISCCFCPK